MDFATAPLGSLLSKLGQLLQDEYNLQKRVKKHIQFVTRELESMHAALRDVGDVPREQLKDVDKIWARDVRALSYDMEDIVDTFLVRVEGFEPPSKRSVKRFMKKMSSIVSKAKARHEIGQEIKDIKERVKEVAERRDRYKVDATTPNKTSIDPRITALYTKVACLVGVDEPRERLISMLIKEHGEMSSAEQGIVSIVGFGGLGKTTLAKTVYDKIKLHFHCAAFVSVSRDPEITKVFKDMLYELDKKEYKDIHNSALGQQHLTDLVRQFLENKRYFIVLDDLWEPRSWETIKLALVENNCGSRIVITTRKFEVAQKADEVYKLEPLSQDDSKKLFYTRLFGYEDKCPTNHVVELSNMILKKCGGVPLSIITMASMLLGKSRKEWIEVCNSPGFYRDKDERHMENTMHILALSYYDLPSHLKTCLLYLSVFPEDTLIGKDSLIQMWIAEGFVQKKQGYWLFEVGEEYFDDLINSSMIQGVVSNAYGIMDGCRVHDMVLDLILSKSKEESFVSDGGTVSQGQAHRLALKNRKLDLTQYTDVNQPQLRTFIVSQCYIAKWALHPRLKLIRVLALEGCTFREGCHNLELIGHLLHLRYLGIRDTWIPELPEGIGALKFLQSLDLEETGIKELPCSIGMLTKLVCLRAKQISAPDGVIGSLTSLAELQIAGPRDNDNSHRQFVKDLGNLCELRVLKIDAIRVLDEGMETDFKHSLSNLQKLQHLGLCKIIGTIDMNAWYATVPCRDLRYLFLRSHIRFPMLPSRINSSQLSSLSHLEIHVDNVDEQGLKALGSLPVLCFLKLVTKGTITCNTEADGCFQKLRSLVLPYSMVQSVANKDSRASFSICFIVGGMAIVRRRMKVPSIVMPNLEELQFTVSVKKLRENRVSCVDLGLENFPSIRKVKVQFYCQGVYARDAGSIHASLIHALEAHPNRPSLQIE